MKNLADVVPEERVHPSVGQRGLIYEFASFRLDPENRLLTREGQALSLPSRAFDTLLMLVQREGQLVTKTDLLNVVWANSFVEESNLTVAISTLRRVLGEDPHDRKFIQTVSGHGYRFICPVTFPPLSIPAPSLVSRREIPETVVPSDPHLELGTPLLIPADPAPVQATPPALPAASRWATTGLWATLAVVVLGSLIAWRVHQASAATFRIRSLAVLPMSGAGVSDYVLLGMTDDLIGHVGSVVAVRPTSSVLRYSSQPVDPKEAGREQGADAVVLSHISQGNGNTKIQVQLVRTTDGRIVWSKDYADRTDRMSSLQDAVDRGLSAELRKFVAGASKTAPVAAKAPVNDAAYQLYLRGRYFWNRRTEDGLHRSIDCFRQSIAIDPNYAPAYAGLADSYSLLASFSVESGSTANPDARAAALSAIQLDPTLAEPHASLGMIYFFTDWNGPAAEREFARAIALNPNYPTAHHWYALDLAAMGRFPEALYEIHRAQALDPLSLIISTNVGWIEYLNRQNDASIADFRKVLELDPSFVRARTRLGIAEIQKGDMEAAIKDLSEAEKMSGDPYVTGLLGEALGKGGHTAAAERSLHELQARSTSKYVPPFSLALVDLGLNRKPEALTELEQAVQDRSTSMVYAKIDPSLDELRQDPKFAKIVAAMKF